MNHPYLKNVALVVDGVVLSVPLAMLTEGLMSMNTPGAYVVNEVFPTGGSGQYNLRLFFLVHNSVDSLLCFAVLFGLYLLFAKLFRWRENDPS